MASLRAHLRQAGDHGRLGFHPDCPVCREERLAGALPSDALISRRVQAMAAAGVFAFSTASPGVVLAAEGDQDQVGTADPATISEPGADTDAGPGDTDAVPDDADAAANDDAADGSATVDPDPVTESDPSEDGPESTAVPPPPAASSVPSTSAAAGQVASRQSADTAPRAKPAVGSSAPVATAPAGAAVAPTGAATSGAAPAAESPAAPSAATPGIVEARHGNARLVRRLLRTRLQAPPAVAVKPAPVAAARPSVKTVTYVAQRVPAAAPVVVRHVGRPAKPRDRVHVVLAGESLWGIAQGVLGAKATVGDVAREVDRLWALNRERIGTGDRDLLPVGTRLVLR